MEIGTYGIKTFPEFGLVANGDAKASTVTTVTAAFNGIKNHLKGLAVAPGHEFEIQSAWALLVQAEALFNSGYAGKPMN